MTPSTSSFVRAPAGCDSDTLLFHKYTLLSINGEYESRGPVKAQGTAAAISVCVTFSLLKSTTSQGCTQTARQATYYVFSPERDNTFSTSEATQWEHSLTSTAPVKASHGAADISMCVGFQLYSTTNVPMAIKCLRVSEQRVL